LQFLQMQTRLPPPTIAEHLNRHFPLPSLGPTRNDSNDSTTLLSVCGLTPQSGEGFLAVQRQQRWLQDFHWLRVTAENGTELEVELVPRWTRWIRSPGGSGKVILMLLTSRDIR
jgi:hypothetical protein